MLSKKMKSVSTKVKEPLKLSSFRAYVGKKVISKSGEKVGKVHNMRFSGSTVSGIVVSRWLSRFFVGLEFVDKISKESVVLSIDPVIMHVGKQVFDADGRKMGKVSGLVRKDSGNSFESIIVKKRFFSKGMTVPKKEIDVIKKNIILKKAYE
jgi:sporulation protein YlmC with PRC-barrel domain